VRPRQQAGLEKRSGMSILWIILIVVLVLALLGFVGRGFR
jgi:flagellar basal body-associated protein FliL